MSFLDGLNDSQKQAVISVDSTILVIAGAGTGKTTTVTHRIAYLIEMGIKPENILALTFTNRAAKEMKERAALLLGRHFGDLLVTTFHSFGLQIIKENAGENFVIYDRSEQFNLIKKLFRGSDSSVQKKAESISRIKNLLDEPDTDTEKLYKDYQIALTKNSALDFDDMIIVPMDILKNTIVLERYKNRFKYIMVDEYQDINPAQYRLLRLISGEQANICAVGDSDQAIYTFRGADIDNFLNFQRDFPSAKMIRLTDNYRSTKNILNASNYIIKNNKRRIDKDLNPVKEDGGKITVLSIPDEIVEGEVIVDEIEARVGGTSHYQHYKGTNVQTEESRRFSDFAVLMRTNAQSRAIEETFIRSGIPYQMIGATHFLERHEVKDVVAYLKAVINPADDMSIARIINRPPRGIGEATFRNIESYAEHHGLSLFDAMKAGSGLGGDRKKRVRKFINLIEHFKKLINEVYADEILNRVIKETGLKEIYPEKVDSFLTLENISVAYRDIVPPSSTMIFINDITLMVPSDAYDPVADKVTIMTLHMAKGLEFRTVFITGVEGGLIPFTYKDVKDKEEERRLFYVGMTRASDDLFILHSRRRFLFGQKLSPSPSPFINEIPKEFIESRFVPDRIVRKRENSQMGLF